MAVASSSRTAVAAVVGVGTGGAVGGAGSGVGNGCSAVVAAGRTGLRQTPTFQ